MAHDRVRISSLRRTLVRGGASGQRRMAWVAVLVAAGIAFACRGNDASRRADTTSTAARGSGSESATATTATTTPTRDTSAGTVAMSSTPADTAGAGRRDTTRPNTARSAPPKAAPRHAAPAPIDSAASATKRSAPEAKESTSAAVESAAAKRDTSLPPTRAGEPATAAQPPAGQGGDNLAVTQSEYNGWKVFAANCTRCHGEDAVGSTIAPSLVKSLRESVTHEVFVQTVTNGRPEKGMPAWGPLLSQQQIEDLYAYLKARSEGRLAPGRPHVKPGG